MLVLYFYLRGEKMLVINKKALQKKKKENLIILKEYFKGRVPRLLRQKRKRNSIEEKLLKRSEKERKMKGLPLWDLISRKA